MHSKILSSSIYADGIWINIFINLDIDEHIGLLSIIKVSKCSSLRESSLRTKFEQQGETIFVSAQVKYYYKCSKINIYWSNVAITSDETSIDLIRFVFFIFGSFVVLNSLFLCTMSHRCCNGFILRLFVKY